eukprot:m51a1_g7780 hypothetical protein (526) ;mRNA; r:220588-223032
MASSSDAQPTDSAARPRVALLYMSLTGNTKHVAELLRDALASEHFEATAVDVTGPAGGAEYEAAAEAAAHCDAIAVGGLAYFWREPSKLRHVIESIPANLVRGKPAFVFGTAGGHEVMLLQNLAEALSRKGAIVVGSLVVYAPPNYSVWAPPAGTRTEWGSSERSKPAQFVRSIAAQLRAGSAAQPVTVRASLAARVVSWFGTDARARSWLGPVTVDPDQCIKCGLCARRCPHGALAIEEGGLPVWDEQACVGCCRCINSCPKGAIASPSTRGKRRYQFSPDVCVDGDFATRNVASSTGESHGSATDLRAGANSAARPRVALLYMSLAGNTRRLALLLRDALVSEHLEATAVDVTGPAGGAEYEAAAEAAAHCDAIAVGGLAYFWREPSKLRHVIESIPANLVRGKPAFVFGCAGTLEGALLHSTAGGLSRKGAVVVGTLLVRAPSNNGEWAPVSGTPQEQWGSKPFQFVRSIAAQLRAGSAAQPIPAGASPASHSVSPFGADGRARETLGADQCATKADNRRPL